MSTIRALTYYALAVLFRGRRLQRDADREAEYDQ